MEPRRKLASTAAIVPSTYILGTKVSHTSYEHATNLVCEWAELKQSRYVCVATVCQVMEGHDSPVFQAVLNQADLVTPDGMPLVWGLKALGQKDATRVYGPDLTPVVLQAAQAKGLKVGFYGGTPDALAKLVHYAATNFPGLQVVYSYSPPFRPLTSDEDAAVVEGINNSGASILFVGMGSPKQDAWMADHRGRLNLVMLGVGAAFDFLTGSKVQAPRWMMKIGLEWFFRLITEPRRLWRRYLTHNPRFVYFFAAQLLTNSQRKTASPIA